MDVIRMMRSSKWILLTGATGLLGSALLRVLVSHGKHVLVIGRTCPHLSDPKVQFVQVDLAKGGPFPGLPRRIEAVAHLAQSRRFRDFPDGASDVFAVNVAATEWLLSYALRANAKQFVYASSGGIYAPSQSALTESHPIRRLQDLGLYLGSKASGEVLAHSFAKHMTISVVRPFFMYGIGQHRDMLLPRLYDLSKRGLAVELQGRDGIRVNPIHVQDAAEAVMQLLAKRLAMTVNLAGPEVLSIREIATAFSVHAGRSSNFGISPGTPHDLIADTSAMQSCLHAPTRRLKDSIEDVAV